MKKIITLIMSGALALSLVACDSQNPSIEEVETAIEKGTLTVEDAHEKGLVDDAWLEEYNKEIEDKSVPASDKMTSNMISEFETTTLDGSTFTNSDLNPVTYFAFINPNTDEGKQAYEVITRNYDAVTEGKGDVLIINTSNEDNELFNDSKFDVVEYNESIINALGTLQEMVNVDGFSGSWNGNGSFLTAWNMILETDDSLLGSMSGIIDMVNKNLEESEDGSATIGAAIMG